jgi:hypothetical protein
MFIYRTLLALTTEGTHLTLSTYKRKCVTYVLALHIECQYITFHKFTQGVNQSIYFNLKIFIFQSS